MTVLLRRLVFCFALALAALPGTALAQAELQQGMQALQRGDYGEARRLLEQVQRDPRAAFVLGQMKSNPRYGMVDYNAAVAHYELAAQAGHAGAMLGLGYLYDAGWGVARNGAAAQELYIEAAFAGIAMARNNLAYLWARQNGLLPEALCLSARTLDEEPDNPYFLDTYGFILLQMKQPERAEAYFRKAIRLLPDYADALEHLGDVAALTGKGDATSYWRRALSNPRDDRHSARLAAKLGGAKLPGDVNAHPPFTLRNPDLPKECGVPSV